MVVVDDSEVFRRALGAFVAITPGLLVVAEAASGDDALAAVARVAPDVVLMDVRMPGLDGIETTRQMKRGPSCPRIVLLTLNDSEHLQRAATEVGADGLLAKSQIPDRLPDLLQALFAQGKREEDEVQLMGVVNVESI